MCVTAYWGYQGSSKYQVDSRDMEFTRGDVSGSRRSEAWLFLVVTTIEWGMRLMRSAKFCLRQVGPRKWRQYFRRAERGMKTDAGIQLNRMERNKNNPGTDIQGYRVSLGINKCLQE